MVREENVNKSRPGTWARLIFAFLSLAGGGYAYFVETHLASVGFWKSLTGDDLEEKHQLETVAEIIVDVLYRCSSFTQVAVTPGGEGLNWEWINSSEKKVE